MTPEEFLAALYTDDTLRAQFLDDPRDTALGMGFSEHEADQLAAIDPEALFLAARSFARKRAAKERLREHGAGLLNRILRSLRGSG